MRSPPKNPRLQKSKNLPLQKRRRRTNIKSQARSSKPHTKIVVMKGTERFEVARTADTKVAGDLKVGAKVTIKYVMTAATVDVKADDKKEAPAKSAKPDKAAPAVKADKAPATK